MSPIVEAQHWQCERCGGRRYTLVQRDDERLSWCTECYDERGELRTRIVTDLDPEQGRIIRDVEDHLAGCYAACPGCDRCRGRRDGDAVRLTLRWYR